jgi:hypothetical protein
MFPASTHPHPCHSFPRNSLKFQERPFAVRVDPHDVIIRRETIVNKFLISLLAGAGALVATSAQAAPLSPVAPVIDSGVENVRMVCNEFGRCWRERGPRYVYRDSYNYYGYAPRYRYRHHHGPGVHFNAPGVSIGIGAGHHHW